MLLQLGSIQRIHRNWNKTHQYQMYRTKTPRCTNAAQFYFPFYDHLRKAICMEEQAHQTHGAQAVHVVSKYLKAGGWKEEEKHNKYPPTSSPHVLSVSVLSQLSSVQSRGLQLSTSLEISISSTQLLLNPHEFYGIQ